MRLADIPATSARDFLRGLLDRNSPRDEFSAWKVEVNLGVEGARVVWAVVRYLDVHRTRGVGIEETDFSLDHIIKFLNGVIDEMKLRSDDEKVLVLGQRELRLMRDAELQLDRYCIMNTPGFSAGKSGGPKRK